MKTTVLICRIMLGLIYLVFGLDYFLHFIPYKSVHVGAAKNFKDGLMAAGYFYPMQKMLQILGGLSLLFNRCAPLFAVALFPISLNVLLFHTLLDPSGWYMGLILVVPNLLLGLGYRKYYSSIFTAKPQI